MFITMLIANAYMIRVVPDFYWFIDGLIGREVHHLLTRTVIVNIVLESIALL